MEPKLVVMAAGIGSRYGGLKQMDGIGPNGEWIIDYSIYDAILAGFKNIVFIISEKIEEDFKSIMNKKYQGKVNMEFVIQDLNDVPGEIPSGRVKPWGTAHAIYATRHIVKGPFAVINADDFYGRDAFIKVYNFLSNPSDDFALIGYKLANTLTDHGSVARGVCETQAGYLSDIVERVHIEKLESGVAYLEGGKWTNLPAESIVSMNMWGFNRSYIDRIANDLPGFMAVNVKENPLKAEFFLPFVVDKMVKDASVRVQVIETDEKWFGVTYSEDKQKVVNAIIGLVDKGVYPNRLLEV